MLKQPGIPADNSRVLEEAGARGFVTIEPLDHLGKSWRVSGSALDWGCPFMLPPWLDAWRLSFDKAGSVGLFVARQRGGILGLVPLSRHRDTVRLVSDGDLIDYSDFIVVPSREEGFFTLLFDYLRGAGVRRIETGRMRADSGALSFLTANAQNLGCSLSWKSGEVLYEMDLPGTWEAYLGLLTGKERHEVLRKLRRLDNAGRIRFRAIDRAGEVRAAMDTFVVLFRSNLAEKARFMTGAVESFFRTLAERLAEEGLLRLFFLDVDDAPVAAVMCFDCGETFFLYNNGYDLRFSHLGVGLLSKVLSIRAGIFLGRKRYNFLRGSEPYKRRLGGRPVQLVQCGIILK